jgi:hypothetical protein
MSYFKDRAAAEAGAHFRLSTTCLCCGEETDGPLVSYDLILPGTDYYTSVLLHRDCAFAMAQRLITDTWQHRHVGEMMKNNR